LKPVETIPHVSFSPAQFAHLVAAAFHLTSRHVNKHSECTGFVKNNKRFTRPAGAKSAQGIGKSPDPL
jgi:hypothetical protein